MAGKLRILVAGNTNKSGVRSAARELARMIDRHRGLSCAGVELGRRKRLAGRRVGLIMALGGDGTVLSICQQMDDLQIPVLGVKFGFKGFLAEVLPEEMGEALDRLAAGRYNVSERMRVAAQVVSGGRRAAELLALNEVAVHAGPVARVVEINVEVDGEQVLGYLGDGIVVATPTGSTAYSLAAGGPIVAQDLDAMVVAPVSPHTLAARPMVVAPHSVIDVEVRCRERRAAITADGLVVRKLLSGDRVVVRRHPKPFLLAELGVRGRYQPVRDNLGWMPASRRR
jgi:NAD+ kinase